MEGEEQEEKKDRAQSRDRIRGHMTSLLSGVRLDHWAPLHLVLFLSRRSWEETALTSIAMNGDFRCTNEKCDMRFNSAGGLRRHARSCPHQYATATALTLKRQADIALYGVQKKAREEENASRLRSAEEVSSCVNHMMGH